MAEPLFEFLQFTESDIPTTCQVFDRARCDNCFQHLQRQLWACEIYAVAKPGISEPSLASLLLSHPADLLGQYFVLFLKGLKNVPHLVVFGAGHCRFESLAGCLLDIQRHEDITDSLAGRSTHRASSSLNDVNAAATRGQKRDHVHCWQVNSFSQAACIGHDSAFGLAEATHYAFTQPGGHRAVDVERLECWKVNTDSFAPLARE